MTLHLKRPYNHNRDALYYLHKLWQRGEHKVSSLLVVDKRANWPSRVMSTNITGMMQHGTLLDEKSVTCYEHRADETQETWRARKRGEQKKWNLELREVRDSNQKTRVESAQTISMIYSRPQGQRRLGSEITQPVLSLLSHVLLSHL